MCGGGSVIGAAAVDNEADMVDEPFGGSSTEVARLSCLSLKPILSDQQLSLATFVTHNPFLPVAGARNIFGGHNWQLPMWD